MSAINGLGAGYGTVYQGASRTTEGYDGLSIDDFYALLAAQMQYQDADNPMDTAEMMSMMVQTQMIDAITQMAMTNTITYATSMMGKNVTVAEVDYNTGAYTNEYITGVVTGVVLGENPILYIDGNPYTMSQVMAVGEVPIIDESETPEEGTDTEGETEGTTDPETDTTI